MLTDTFVRQVRASGKAAGDKHTDSLGLYLLVKPAGKYWRMDYRYAGKRRTLAMGVYPAVTLAKARQMRDRAREALAEGNDPSAAKAEIKAARIAAAANTFESVAREYAKARAPGLSANYNAAWMGRMNRHLFPAFGRKPIAGITAADVLGVLRVLDKRGIPATTRLVAMNASQVFAFAMRTERCASNPAEGLREDLAPRVVKHRAALLEPVAVGGLMRAIDAFTGHPVTRAALEIAALTFQRPGNVRTMEWEEVDLDGAMWTIPAAKLKGTRQSKATGQAHSVPLSMQAVTVLRDLHALTGMGRFVFPSLIGNKLPIGETTLIAALRRMGFTKEEMSPHGFRAMARTLLDEVMGERVDLIEHQLAHSVRDALGRAYNRTSHLPARVSMMQRWADYLDKVRRGADVIPLRTSA